MSGPEPTSYDRDPYPSAPYAQSHPSRLSAIATLFGMRAAPVRTARILELGCADGSNLIPMAAEMPGCALVGVDLSQRQVARGREMIDRLGLSNVRLECRDIRDVGRDSGPFDYIIAHGVFSWVPRDVQESMLALCGQILAERGIAYISYNTYPGWHLRESLRRMMLYHTGQSTDAARRAGQARALVQFLADAVPQDNDPYGMLLHKELREMKGWDDAYLRHDVLEEVNEPVYFHEFARRAAAHGLRYLGEAEFHTMVGDNLPGKVADTLRRLTTDLIQTEQYMDFVRNRTFRQTLLCRQEVPLERRVTAARLAGLWVGAPLRQESPSTGGGPTTDGPPAVFIHPGGGTIRAGSAIARAAFQRIADAWPAAVEVTSLVESTVGPSGGVPSAIGAGPAAALANTILECVSRGLLVLSSDPPLCAPKPGPRPLASPLARAQAQTSLVVTTLRHEVLRLEPIHAHLLPLLDGTRTADALVEALLPAAVSGPLSLRADGEVIRDPERLRPLLQGVLVRSLDELARAALLTQSAE